MERTDNKNRYYNLSGLKWLNKDNKYKFVTWINIFFYFLNNKPNVSFCMDLYPEWFYIRAKGKSWAKGKK